jgi:hypothetical protein
LAVFAWPVGGCAARRAAADKARITAATSKRRIFNMVLAPFCIGGARGAAFYCEIFEIFEP